MSDWELDSGDSGSEWEVDTGKQSRGVFGDIGHSLLGAPEAIAHALKALPSEAYKSAQQAYHNPVRALGNISAGIGEGFQGAFNTPYYLAQYLKSKGVPGFGNADYVPHAENLGVEKFLGLDQPQEGDALLRGLASFLPYSRVGAAAKGLSGVGQRALAGGLYAGGQNQDPIQGAGMVGLLEGLMRAPGAIKQGVGALRPSKMFEGSYSPEQLANNLEASQGTETNLGRVVGNPALSKLYENHIANIWGSGAHKTMGRTAEQVKQQANDYLSNLVSGESPEIQSSNLADLFQNAHNEAKQVKNKMYEDLDALAPQGSFMVNRNNFQSKAQKILDDINQSPELKEEFTPGFISDMKRYASIGQGNNLKLTNIFSSKLGDKANELYRAGKKHEGNQMASLQKSLKQDMEDAFQNSDNPQIKEAYRNAQLNYKENYAPFEDSSIIKSIRRGNSPSDSKILSLSSLALRNQNKELLNINPKLIASRYLSQALDEDGNINPMKLKTLYNKLDSNQRKGLFPKETNPDQLKNIVKNIEMNPEAFTQMFNPKTGMRAAQMMGNFIPALTGAGLGGFHGGIEGIIGSALLGKSLNALLTSEKFRTKFVNKQISNKTPKEHAESMLVKALRSGTKGLVKQVLPLELELTKDSSQLNNNE